MSRSTGKKKYPATEKPNKEKRHVVLAEIQNMGVHPNYSEI